MSSRFEILRKEQESIIQERKIAIGGVSLALKEMERAMTGFDLGHTMLDFETLMLFELDERMQVNDGVEFVKTYQDDEKMVFLTYMQDGGSFGIHSHDCYEKVEIIEGVLIETERGYKSYSKGESLVYAPYEKHKPYATRNSMYQVTFYKTL